MKKKTVQTNEVSAHAKKSKIVVFFGNKTIKCYWFPVFIFFSVQQLETTSLKEKPNGKYRCRPRSI